MPEYPEVYTVISKIKSIFLGAKILAIKINLPKMFPDYDESLTNKVITDISQIGKYIIFHLEDKILISHLRMEGKYYSSYDHITADNKHIHVVFNTDKGKLYYHDTRQFGRFYLRNKDNYLISKPLCNVAQNPFDINLTVFYKRLLTRSISIKQALLDQKVMSGLGNIYANEVLYACGISPFKVASSITQQQAQDILKQSQLILQESINQGGTTIHSFSSMGDAGKFQNKLLIHGKNNQKCPKCGTLIKKEYINKRGTYYCGRCQK